MIDATQASAGATQDTGAGTAGMPRPRLSVIVPLYNEQESIRPLYAAIVQALGDIGTVRLLTIPDGP